MGEQTQNSHLRVVVVDDDQTVLLAATAGLIGLGLQPITGRMRTGNASR
jgi:hypothetical protein